MADLHTCPNPEYQAEQRDKEIPDEHKHLFSGDGWFYRTIGVYAYDHTLYYQCPECGGAWHRFPVGHYLYHKAAEHMRVHGVQDYTLTLGGE